MEGYFFDFGCNVEDLVIINITGRIPRDLDDLGESSPVPRGRRQRKRGPGLQVSGAAGPAGALVGFGIALAGCLFREVLLAPAQMTS